MKKIYLLLILSFTAFESYAQNNEFVNLKNNYDRLRKEEKNDSALLIAKQMNAWAFQNEGDTSFNYAVSYKNIGNTFYSLEQNDSAFYYYNFSLSLLKSQNRVIHVEYAGILNNLGNMYRTVGNYHTAEGCLKQALIIRKEVLGEQNLNYASTLGSLAVLYTHMGNYDLALSYYKQALEIKKKVLGDNHIDNSSTLNNLGILYSEIGDYKSAEKYFKKSLEVKIKVLSDQHFDCASTLNNLGILYKNMGDFKSSVNYLQQGFELRKKKLGTKHPDYAGSINNLGVLAHEMHDYKLAESYFIQSIEVIKIKFGDQHPMYAAGLNGLGKLYTDMGDFKSAELYLKQALEIRKKVLGDQHPDYASSINCIGILYIRMGDYKVAESYLNESAEIQKKVLSNEHPDYLTSLNSLAFIYSKTNRNKDALLIYESSAEILNKKITSNFEWLNDKEKELYWNKNRGFYNSIDQFATNNINAFPQVTTLSYNSNLFTKGKLLEAKISKENDLAEIVELREKLSFLRKKLAKLNEDNEGSNYKKLEDEANLLDSKLTQMWDEYATQKKNLSITWDKVQANLTSDEAAIEFVRYKSDNDSQYYYNALIVRKMDVYPVLVPLCSENQLKEVLNKGFSAYYPLVWAPIDTFLNEIKTIYYSPVGMLNKIPFAALYSKKNGGDEVTYDKKTKKIVSKTESGANYLMNRYTLHQLTSTRYLAMGIKEKSMNKIDKSIALIGGVNYDYLPGVKKKTVKKEMLLATREANFTQPLGYLAGTKLEVDAISKQMQNNGWETTLLENDSATEDNVIKYENQTAKGILHIATHGFAFPNIKDLPTNSDSTISKNSFCYYTNPLQRCGLILAGANWTWMGSEELKNRQPDAEDGILTAAQVALLNLRKTNLVVLSACETGLGKIEGSEGVLGLTRAFKLAGVEQIIVSLWEVPDKETMELMTLFYEDLSKTQNAIISFEKAQKIMALKYPTRPDMWAGFVLVR